MLNIATIIKPVKIKSYEIGLLYRDGEFSEVLDPGEYRFINPFAKVEIVVIDRRLTWFYSNELSTIVRSGKLGERAIVLDLADDERALVWIDNRINTVLAPGLYVLWTGFSEIRTERIKVDTPRFDSTKLLSILNTAGADELLDTFQVKEGCEGLYFLDGKFVESLTPGLYAFWKNINKVKVHSVSKLEIVLDISGQEIMTSDKVSLRLNAVVTYRIEDALKSVNITEDAKQAIYRDAQLALRAVVGERELDSLLTEKDKVIEELEQDICKRAKEFGVQIVSVGIRDVILPGEMKVLLNKVTEAKKAAEANLITRREETAAMRSQANTAKMLENNPALMRLRELEVLQNIASNSNLQVVLGEKGLSERVMKLI